MTPKSAKQQAIQDIKLDLALQGKAFIAFHRVLNKPINDLVNKQIERQKHLHNT